MLVNILQSVKEWVRDWSESTFLKLSGGTLTGALNGTSATFSDDVTSLGEVEAQERLVVNANEDNYGAIRFNSENAAYDGVRFYGNNDEYGDEIVVGAGGRLIAGSGESAYNLHNALIDAGETPGIEQTYIASDSSVYLVPNCQTIADRRNFEVRAEGIMTPSFSGISYIEGGQGKAALYVRKNTGSVWYPAITLDTTSGGSWSIGNYNNENLQFSWASKANRDSSTNTVNVVNLPNNPGIIPVPVSLYGNNTGVTGTVSLSQSAANFNYMRIYFYVNRDSHIEYGATDVYSPNGKRASLLLFRSTVSGQVDFAGAIVSISGTSITRVSTRIGSFTGSSTTATSNDNNVYIIRVEGWK